MSLEPKKPTNDNQFLTGVCEGFYGRPWTYPQRKELFRRMNHMGMNAYLYAPKDDIKHRQSWRDLYSLEEEQLLQSLISVATEAGVLFIFAISPGLDVVFSSAKEVESLKNKVDQVSKLGCRAFALLFDDIEPRLCPADREVFTSSARAQSVFANDIYNYLGCPGVFLFCPTEYSASLAVPNVAKSEYLSTIASCLAPGIAVIWTGSLVVSKKILAKEVRELSKFLQHPIVLWDNLHANDYDQRRVFIGPYAGRSLGLRRQGLIKGVLTNPNCEFEANYVALHTLAQWSRYAELKYRSEIKTTSIQDETDFSSTTTTTTTTTTTESADENGTIDSIEGDEMNQDVYRPREALLVALRDWLSLMFQDQQLTQTSKPGTAGGTPIPMDTDTAEITEQPTDGEMQVDVALPSVTGNLLSPDMVESVDVTLEDLELFADLFYLPFGHGPTGIRLLELGHWLRDHSYSCGPDSGDTEKHTEWNTKLAEFVEVINSVTRLRERIQRLPSRSISYELAPYVTEIYVVLGMVFDYFRWLGTGVMASRTTCHLRRLLTWFSPGYRDMVTSGDQEPWTFRGGLTTELQRILPLESAQDLFPAPSRTLPNMNWSDAAPPPNGTLSTGIPSVPLNLSLNRCVHAYAYVVRPYQPADKPVVYKLFRRLLLHRLGLPENTLPPELTDLPGDRYLLHFLEHSPENCLVVEGPSFQCSTSASNSNCSMKESRCVGFGFAAVNVVAWALDRSARYKNVLRAKYPSPAAYETDFTARNQQDGAATDRELMNRLQTDQLPQAESSSDSQISSIKHLMTGNEFIKFLLHAFHAEPTEMADIAEAVTLLPPPEPLGGALPSEPALSGCLQSDIDPDRRLSVTLQSEISPPSFPPGCLPPSTVSTPPPIMPPPIIPDTAPPSPPSTQPPPQPQLATSDSCSSSPAGVGAGSGLNPPRPIIAVGGPEAIHSALAAHPATLLVEFDDIEIGNCLTGPTPAMLFNHNLCSGMDPPELVLDSIVRRLFVCLLAGIKTIGAHGCHVELDLAHEQRADLYRRFGFYPIPAASTEQTIVLARLI